MKTLAMWQSVFYKLAAINLMLALCSLIAWGQLPANELRLEVTITTGEHSRDSNSVTRTLTVSSGKLVYEEAYQGAHSNRRQPVRKEFELTKQDQAALIGLLKENNLLANGTISKPPQQKGFSRYFELSILSKLGGKETTVSIDAFPGAAELKTDRLYQGSVNLIEQLYVIINRTDPNITSPTLID